MSDETLKVGRDYFPHALGQETSLIISSQSDAGSTMLRVKINRKLITLIAYINITTYRLLVFFSMGQTCCRNICLKRGEKGPFLIHERSNSDYGLKKFLYLTVSRMSFSPYEFMLRKLFLLYREIPGLRPTNPRSLMCTLIGAHGRINSEVLAGSPSKEDSNLRSASPSFGDK